MDLKELIFKSNITKYVPDIEESKYLFPFETNNLKALKYSVPISDGRINKVFAFYGSPHNDVGKKLPAVVLVHGGDGCAAWEWVKKWTSRGYVAIAPDFDSQEALDENNRREYNKTGGPRGYGSENQINIPESSWTYFSLLSIMCAVTILQHNPIVDKDKIVLDGISWGGYLALFAAEFDKRIKCVCVIYASAFIPDCLVGKSRNLDKEPNRSNYYKVLDPSAYLSKIEVPVFFAAGCQDVCFSVKYRKMTSDSIHSKKIYSYRKNYPHGHIEGWAVTEAIDFSDYVLNGAKLPAEIMIEQDKNLVSTKIKGDVKDICLYYTQDDLNKDVYVWKEIPSKDKTAKWYLPPKVTCWFVGVKTIDNKIFSSDFFVDKKIEI